MPNDFPTYPDVLAEATPWSLSDLALMSSEEHTPASEMAYIQALRDLRERYERALGQTKAPKAKPAGATKASKVVGAILDGGTTDSDGEGLF